MPVATKSTTIDETKHGRNGPIALKRVQGVCSRWFPGVHGLPLVVGLAGPSTPRSSTAACIGQLGSLSRRPCRVDAIRARFAPEECRARPGSQPQPQRPPSRDGPDPASSALRGRVSLLATRGVCAAGRSSSLHPMPIRSSPSGQISRPSMPSACDRPRQKSPGGLHPEARPEGSKSERPSSERLPQGSAEGAADAGCGSWVWRAGAAEGGGRGRRGEGRRGRRLRRCPRLRSQPTSRPDWQPGGEAAKTASLLVGKGSGSAWELESQGARGPGSQRAIFVQGRWFRSQPGHAKCFTFIRDRVGHLSGVHHESCRVNFCG